MVQLSDELLEVLDGVALRGGVSRSALIRDLLWEALRGDLDALIGEQIAAGYRRVPQGEPDDWGDIGASGDAATEDLLRRLNAEEQPRGQGSW